MCACSVSALYQVHGHMVKSACICICIVHGAFAHIDSDAAQAGSGWLLRYGFVDTERVAGGLIADIHTAWFLRAVACEMLFWMQKQICRVNLFQVELGSMCAFGNLQVACDCGSWQSWLLSSFAGQVGSNFAFAVYSMVMRDEFDLVLRNLVALDVPKVSLQQVNLRAVFTWSECSSLHLAWPG